MATPYVISGRGIHTSKKTTTTKTSTTPTTTKYTTTTPTPTPTLKTTEPARTTTNTTPATCITTSTCTTYLICPRGYGTTCSPYCSGYPAPTLTPGVLPCSFGSVTVSSTTPHSTLTTTAAVESGLGTNWD
ncbi:hypothetical protein H072_9686 [Dactylellina haptotyla CBS 200.50]|uniref:Uncharacterized protein n=1 Tax=Dactylellina haptotyla (strain CBS 200.50) TaxID=1284197 RepID=S8A6P1_DACHA|nr:hypothetical protein H072_9686 [Dactylellina haptotyla CBS 200.50]